LAQFWLYGQESRPFLFSLPSAVSRSFALSMEGLSEWMTERRAVLDHEMRAASSLTLRFAITMPIAADRVAAGAVLAQGLRHAPADPARLRHRRPQPQHPAPPDPPTGRLLERHSPECSVQQPLGTASALRDRQEESRSVPVSPDLRLAAALGAASLSGSHGRPRHPVGICCCSPVGSGASPPRFVAVTLPPGRRFLGMTDELGRRRDRVITRSARDHSATRKPRPSPSCPRCPACHTASRSSSP
jgi:hypothetical protein